MLLCENSSYIHAKKNCFLLKRVETQNHEKAKFSTGTRLKINSFRVSIFLRAAAMTLEEIKHEKVFFFLFSLQQEPIARRVFDIRPVSLQTHSTSVTLVGP